MSAKLNEPEIAQARQMLEIAFKTLKVTHNLRPGAFARAEVTVSNARRTVLPQTAVLTDEKGTYVLVVTAEKKVERRAVHVSGIVGNGVSIADGVKDKEEVVATAGAFLQEGELVRPILKDGGAS